jgi:hypothetical protein
MEQSKWEAFCEFRTSFKCQINKWNDEYKGLLGESLPDCKNDNPLIVFNDALNSINEQSDIKLIIVGDNPGKDEQKEGRYFEGQAGKMAKGFFRIASKELGIEDFDKEVICLNRTPIHTATTAELKQLHGSKILYETQEWMAKETAKLHKELGCELWIIGYSNLKRNAVFSEYCTKFREAYGEEKHWEKVFVFKHFSNNHFIADIGQDKIEYQGEEIYTYNQKLSFKENLHNIGKEIKDKIAWT